MTKKVNSKRSQNKQTLQNQSRRKIQISTIAAAVSAVATLIAIYISFSQGRANTRETAPQFSLEHVEIKAGSTDSSQLFFTVQNSGQRSAIFKYDYTYVFNTSRKMAIANSVFTTYEILPNKNVTWNFFQSNSLTRDPNTYYCTKIWYVDEEIKATQAKELFYKLNNIIGVSFPSNIPNDVLKLFKTEISKYEKSALFKTSDM